MCVGTTWVCTHMVLPRTKMAGNSRERGSPETDEGQGLEESYSLSSQDERRDLRGAAEWSSLLLVNDSRAGNSEESDAVGVRSPKWAKV